MHSIARACSPAVLPTRSPLLSLLRRLPIPIASLLRPSVLAVRRPREEMNSSLRSIAPASGGVTLTQIHGRLFHVDFVTPANSTFGLGPNHLPNAEITVNGFVDAFTTTTNLVPQQGTATKLDTLGDKIMTPVVYQNRAGTESLWADSTVLLNYPNGPTAVRWYQFNVTGGTFPATAAQQQDWTNSNDGLWRFMPSIAVDAAGNTVVGYATSGTSQFPSIRYAGRLVADPPNNLTQGEATMFPGTASQTSTITLGRLYNDNPRYRWDDVLARRRILSWRRRVAYPHRKVQFRRRRRFSNSYCNAHHQPLHRRQLRVAAPGLPVRTCLRCWSERLAFISRPTATFTPWAVALRTRQDLTSSTPFNTRLVPTAGRRDLRHFPTTK